MVSCDSKQFMQRLACAVILALSAAAYGAPVSALGAPESVVVTYNIDMTPGTKDGNNVVDLMSLEAGAGPGQFLAIIYAFPVSGTGTSVLRHLSSFVPQSALLIGLDGPPDAVCGTDPLCGTHVVMLVNQEFARTAIGQHFHVDFPNTHESDMISMLVAAERGNSTADTWVNNFFLTGDGSKAAFTPGDPFTAIEFTVAAPVGGGTSTVTPEPSTVVLLAAGLGAMIAARRRNRKSTCFTA